MPGSQAICPFCNSPAPIPAPLPPSGQIDCPRCGERFPIPTSPGHAIATPPTPVSAPLPVPPSPRRSLPWAWIGGGIVVVLVGLLAWILGGGLDSEPEPSPLGRTSVELPPPIEWASLRWLPDHTDAIIALRPAAALDRLREVDPTLAEQWYAEIPPPFISGIRRLTGREIRDFDETVLALQVHERLLPGAWLILRVSESFDANRLDRNANEVLNQNGKTIYRLGDIPGLTAVYVWLAKPDVLVAALTPEEFASFPNQERTELRHLSQSMRQLISGQIPEHAIVWAVAETAEWPEFIVGIMAPIVLPEVPPEAFPELRQLAISTAAVDEGLSLRLGLRFNETIAQDLAARWTNRYAGTLIEIDQRDEWSSLSITGTPDEFRASFLKVAP